MDVDNNKIDRLVSAHLFVILPISSHTKTTDDFRPWRRRLSVLFLINRGPYRPLTT